MTLRLEAYATSAAKLRRLLKVLEIDDAELDGQYAEMAADIVRSRVDDLLATIEQPVLMVRAS